MEIYIKLFEVLFPVFSIVGIGYYLGKKDPNFDTTFITNFAEAQINLGENTAHWQAALDWLHTEPNLSDNAQKKIWNQYVGQPGEYLIPDEYLALSLWDYLKLGFASSYNPFPAFLSSNLEKIND